MNQYLQIIIGFVISYLLGSIPSSIIIGKIFYKKDIRQFGSGNAGGTNTFRVFGWKAGIVVSAFDIFKGFAAAYFIPLLFPITVIPIIIFQLFNGLFAIIGHIWTVFAQFKGGKGVATAIGTLLAIFPVSLGIAAIFSLVILFSTGIVSLTSVSGTAIFAVITTIRELFFVQTSGIDLVLYIGIAWFFALLILFTHRQNIKRILAGEENSFPKLKILFRKNQKEIKG